MRQGRVAAPQPHPCHRVVGRPQLHVAGKAQGRRGGAGSSLLSVCHTSPQLGALQQHGDAQLSAQGTEESWLCVVPYWYQRWYQWGSPSLPHLPRQCHHFLQAWIRWRQQSTPHGQGWEVALQRPCTNHMFLSETSVRADRAPNTSQPCTHWPPSPLDVATLWSQEQKAPTRGPVPARGRNQVPAWVGGRLVSKNTKSKEALSSPSPRWLVFYYRLHPQDGLCHITQD